MQYKIIHLEVQYLIDNVVKIYVRSPILKNGVRHILEVRYLKIKLYRMYFKGTILKKCSLNILKKSYT